jgi:hypothetical protein
VIERERTLADDSPTSSIVNVRPEESAASQEADETRAFEGPAPPSLAPATRRARRFMRLKQFFRTGVGVWVGLLITVAGFGLLVYTWSETASLLNVALQVPFLVSGGLTGLGLILVGLLVINLAVRRREALDRERQLDEVREALVRLRGSIEGSNKG